jgi:Transposase DDE domain group 1
MGAYWLLHALRRAAPKRSRWRGATLETIRRTFVKIAARVEELKSKIKLAFPAAYPHQVMLLNWNRATCAALLVVMSKPVRLLARETN